MDGIDVRDLTLGQCITIPANVYGIEHPPLEGFVRKLWIKFPGTPLQRHIAEVTLDEAFCNSRDAFVTTESGSKRGR